MYTVTLLSGTFKPFNPLMISFYEHGVLTLLSFSKEYLRREAVVKIFLPPFGCDLVRPPYVVIDSNLFSMTFYFREI